ncbi:molybdopterin-binding protein [Acetobacterium carbinolicum]|uniref:molybdopterin-binding protein n=1 Tax=Acetobacterium carbinolicum TaxID=52690 RepID=UPI0039BFE2F4
MKLVAVQDAVGMLLAHDMTQIIPGEYKGARFKKGHMISMEDIPQLLNMGKEHVGIIEYREGDIHENDAALRMAKAMVGSGIKMSDPSEGKVKLIAERSGLLKINAAVLDELNEIEDLMTASIHGDRLVEKDMVIGGTRIIPLVTVVENVEKMEAVCRKKGPVFEILPLKKFKVGIVTTGSEVFYKRIEDKFGPVIRRKFAELDCDVVGQIYSSDNVDMITESIFKLIDMGADLITCTGGMSVDPDDVTPVGIKNTGANIITYGAPTLPGAMFMLGYLNQIPIVGLPGCVMYAKRTIFDLIVPRLVAEDPVTRQDIVKLGHGGMCLECETCVFPNCGFGR